MCKHCNFAKGMYIHGLEICNTIPVKFCPACGADLSKKSLADYTIKEIKELCSERVISCGDCPFHIDHETSYKVCLFDLTPSSWNL